MAAFQIANKTVGKDAPVFIIAEAGINHDGKLDQAFALIDAAAEAGADAVKFQMFQADRMYQKDPGLYKTAAGKDVSIFLWFNLWKCLLSGFYRYWITAAKSR